MEKKLNLSQINASMDKQGLNQAGLSKKLGVSRTIVSSWFKGKKFPRPDKLLKLGVVLGLPFQDVVEKSPSMQEPIIAYRKKAARKTKDIHLDQAREMGHLLELLVPYMPDDRIFQVPVLKQPKIEYSYIQNVARKIRQELEIEDDQPVSFEQLIEKMNAFDVCPIPVFHGSKEIHENALHIYLPSSNTTWIYLNLDTNIHDFKFWMAHELGHVLAPSLTGEDGEDFADLFAQSFLFPESQAEDTYKSLRRIRNRKSLLNKIVEISECLIISPVTVYKAVCNYTDEYDYNGISLEPDIYVVTSRLNKKYPNVSKALFEKEPLTVSSYIKMSKTVFNSPFFDILQRFLSENEKSAGFIQSVLDTSILDARELHAQLVG